MLGIWGMLWPAWSVWSLSNGKFCNFLTSSQNTSQLTLTMASQLYHQNTAAAYQCRRLSCTSTSMQRPEPAVRQFVAQQLFHHEHFHHLGLATSILKEYCDKLGKENTLLAYEPKQNKYNAYCDIVCSREPDHCRQTVTHEKLYDFMLYVSFHPKK